MIELNETDLLALMKSGEDHLVERKVVSDHKDWKKTAVAFANSVPVGLPAVLFIGVRDNGEIEPPPKDLDEAEKRFTTIMQKVYPRIFYVTKTISENGKQALAVIIPGSELRPHFAGLSYVRRGSQSDPASEEQFAELIAQRNGKTARILAWKDKAITIMQHAKQPTGVGFNEMPWKEGTIVVNCDQFYVTVLVSPTGVPESFPLRDVEINRDNLRHRLQLEIWR
jgi:predicted HTH transcriptional regulator